MRYTATILALIFTSLSISGQNNPIDFEAAGNGAQWTWTTFENASNPELEIVSNPAPDGVNASSTVAKFTALQAGQPFAGCESMHGSDIGTFTLTSSNSLVRIMVHKTTISDVGIKLVNAASGALPEIKVANTLIDQWEELSFDLSSLEEGAIGAVGPYDQIVIFPDFTDRIQDNIIYFDNIVFGDNALGLDETQLADISISPNPVEDMLEVQTPVQIESFELLDVTGKIVWSDTSPMRPYLIESDQLNSGVYFLSIMSQNQKVTRRIVKR